MNYVLVPLKDGGWEVRADSRFAPALTLDEARRVLIDALEAVTDQRAAEKLNDSGPALDGAARSTERSCGTGSAKTGGPGE